MITESPTAVPTAVPTPAPTVTTEFGSLLCDYNASGQFSGGTLDVCWIRYLDCEEGDNPSTLHHPYTVDQLVDIAQYAVTLKILPSDDVPGSDETCDFGVTADVCSNPVFALNKGYALSHELDEWASPPVITGYADTDNWIGTNKAKKRLKNSCYGDRILGEEPQTLLNGRVYHACGLLMYSLSLITFITLMYFQLIGNDGVTVTRRIWRWLTWSRCDVRD